MFYSRPVINPLRVGRAGWKGIKPLIRQLYRLRAICVYTPDADGVAAVMKCPREDNVMSARRKAENDRRRIADQLGRVLSTGVPSYEFGKVGCEQATICGPVEILDMIAAGGPRTSVGRRAAFTGQDIKIAGYFLLNRGQSLAV